MDVLWWRRIPCRRKWTVRRRVVCFLLAVPMFNLLLLMLFRGGDLSNPRQPPGVGIYSGVKLKQTDRGSELVRFMHDNMYEDQVGDNQELDGMAPPVGDWKNWGDEDADGSDTIDVNPQDLRGAGIHVDAPTPDIMRVNRQEEDLITDTEGFDRPLAVTGDVSVLTEDGALFWDHLSAKVRLPERLMSQNPDERFNLTILTIGMKVGTMLDIRYMLEPLGVKFIEHNFSPHCHVINTCSKGLDIINQDNLLSITPSTWIQFYEKFKNDPQFTHVDAFLCVYPASVCELFIPFNKTLVILVESRYEAGRLDLTSWTRWNTNLLNMSLGPRHILRANNDYDAEYLRYFLRTAVRVIPPACTYLQHSYNPTRTEFLLMPVSKVTFVEKILAEFEDALRTERISNVTLLPVTRVHPDLRQSDLSCHPALVVIPHQVSSQAFLEYYRMGLPMYVPSLHLLTRWHYTTHVVEARTLNAARRRHGVQTQLQQPRDPLPNPNDDSSQQAMEFWFMFADHYVHPHLVYFHSMEDLARKLGDATPQLLQEQSNAMREYSENYAKTAKGAWRGVMKKVVNTQRG